MTVEQAITDFRRSFNQNIFNWDYNVGKICSYEIREIFNSINMQQVHITKCLCNIVAFETKY